MIHYSFHYKFESNHTEYRALTSSELKNENNVFSICPRKIQSPRSIKCLGCLNFIIDLTFFMSFTEARGEMTELQ